MNGTGGKSSENQVKTKNSEVEDDEEEKEKKKRKRDKSGQPYQNNTLGRASHERADDETASTNLPHAKWRLTALLANNRQAKDDLILDDG